MAENVNRYKSPPLNPLWAAVPVAHLQLSCYHLSATWPSCADPTHTQAVHSPLAFHSA